MVEGYFGHLGERIDFPVQVGVVHVLELILILRQFQKVCGVVFEQHGNLLHCG